jgi:molybdate transport system ATP-binding protein
MAAELVARFTKRYPGGVVIEADLGLEPDRAPVTVLFGPSGSGKTTILRCLAGLERPEEGTIRFGDEVWLDTARGVGLPPQQRRIAYLSQDYALFPHLTVGGNIAFGLTAPAVERRRRVADLVARLGLEGLEGRYPSRISGGQAQRVALARALATEPRLLLLDEPLSSLDAPLREPLRRELRQWLTSVGIPALVVTHDRIEALALGDRLAVLAEGRIRQTGPVHEVFSRPADLAVARTVGVETVVPGRVVATSDSLATVAVGDVRILAFDPGDAGQEVFVCIRAEEVVVEQGQSSRTSARNHLPGRVTRLEPEGPLVRVRLDCGFPLAALVTRPACEDLGLDEGAPVTAIVKATSIHLVHRVAPAATGTGT